MLKQLDTSAIRLVYSTMRTAMVVAQHRPYAIKMSPIVKQSSKTGRIGGVPKIKFDTTSGLEDIIVIAAGVSFVMYYINNHYRINDDDELIEYLRTFTFDDFRLMALKWLINKRRPNSPITDKVIAAYLDTFTLDLGKVKALKVLVKYRSTDDRNPQLIHDTFFINTHHNTAVRILSQ